MDYQLSTRGFDSITAHLWAEGLASIKSSLRDAKCLLRYERRYTEEIVKVEERSSDTADRLAPWREWFR